MNLKTLHNIATSRIPHLVPQQLASRKGAILKWTVVGLGIRFAIMPILAGPDFATITWISFTLIQKNLLIFSADPPAVFFLLGGFYKLILPLFPSTIVNYMTSSISYTPPPFQVFAMLYPGIHTFLFLAKIPFLVFDILSGFLILRFFVDEKKALLAFKIWLVNPITIAISFVYGQYDIIPVFFLISSLIFLKEKKYGLTALSVGVASMFKVFSLAFLPIIAIAFWKDKHRTEPQLRLLRTSGLIVAGLLPLLATPLLLTIIPQYYESANFAMPAGPTLNGFFGNTFYSQGVPAQPFFSGLVGFLVNSSASIQTHISIADFVFFIPFIYTLILLGTFYESGLSHEKAFKYFTVFLLLYYAFSLFYPQWFLWVQPLLVLLIAENPKIYGKLFVLLVPLFFVYTFSTDNVLTSLVLIPIIPRALFWPGVSSLMSSAGLPATEIINIFRTILSAICVFVAYHIAKTSFWTKGSAWSEPASNGDTLQNEEAKSIREAGELG